MRALYTAWRLYQSRLRDQLDLENEFQIHDVRVSGGLRYTNDEPGPQQKGFYELVGLMRKRNDEHSPHRIKTKWV